MGIFDNFKVKISNTLSNENSKNCGYADSSEIPEEERKYYQPDEYYQYKNYVGTTFEFEVIPFEKRKTMSIPSSRGLYVPEILMISLCTSFPSPKNGYPGYWWFKYGVRNVGSLLQSLEERGYISIDSRAGKYHPTELGDAEIKDNEYVLYTHKNSKVTDCTAWDMNLAIGHKQNVDWLKIFCDKNGIKKPLILEKNDVNVFDSNAPKKKIDSRIPLDKIKNLSDWDKGFSEGSPYYADGEQYRKAGDYYKAISLYDKARYHGYDAPALYLSYAMTFDKMKDYDNEIEILEEGMTRMVASAKKEIFAEKIEKAKKHLTK